MRLDQALAARGLVRSRTDAARSISAGHVLVNGKPAHKAAMRVGDDDQIEITQRSEFVSRAAGKLQHALTVFGCSVAERTALDLGASTGGFTQVLLAHGCSRVVALDVGHDQLAAEIRDDGRVTVIEGENARFLDQSRLDTLLTGRDAQFCADDIDLVVGDLSFISLRHILPIIWQTVANARDTVLLIKPQFEVGRSGVSGGIVRDDALAVDAVCDVIENARAIGFHPQGITASPVEGTHGNREYLLWLRRGDAADGPAVDSAAEGSGYTPIPADWDALQHAVRKIVGYRRGKDQQ